MADRKWWGVWGGIVLLGMGLSIRDYSSWKHAEFDKYGHGYEQPKASVKELSQVYENKGAGVRIKYPPEWTLQETATGRELQLVKAAEKLKPGVRVQLAKWGQEMEAAVEIQQGTLEEAGNREAEALKKQSINIAGERVYLTGDRGTKVIFTWQTSEVKHQRMLAVKYDREIILDVEMPVTKWNEYGPTVNEIFDQLTIL